MCVYLCAVHARVCVRDRESFHWCLIMCCLPKPMPNPFNILQWSLYLHNFTPSTPPVHACEPPSIRLTVAMVTITTPWRQQWEADWEGGEGEAALRDERKMMAGREEDGWYKEKCGGNAEGDVTEAVQWQLGWGEGGDGGEWYSDTYREPKSWRQWETTSDRETVSVCFYNNKKKKEKVALKQRENKNPIASSCVYFPHEETGLQMWKCVLFSEC